MIFLYFLVGLLAGMVIMGGIWKYWYAKQEQKRESGEAEKLDISLEDILRLAALNINLDIDSLIVEYHISARNSKFYDKYQELVKRQKEWYYDELLNILGKNRRNYVNELLERYHHLSTQDVLLLLMGEMQLGNKTMARVMQLNVDALKKRKSRLKLKMQLLPDSKNSTIS